MARKMVDNRNIMSDVDPSVEMELWQKRSIYRVPGCIKDLNVKAYKPQMVSFGPYHHGDPDLLPMEEHKRRALFYFLKRVGIELEEILSEMGEIVQQLQECYQNLGEEWADKDQFLQLMILDGCFMLEVIAMATGNVNYYLFKDPFFVSCGMLLPYIRRDMLMLENQLPLLVMEKLYQIVIGLPGVGGEELRVIQSTSALRTNMKRTIGTHLFLTSDHTVLTLRDRTASEANASDGQKQDEYHVNKMVLKFCAPNAQPPIPGTSLALHPLDLFRKSLLQGPEERFGYWQAERVLSESIWSAQELYEAGIRIKKSKSNNLLDIRFENGVLRLPEMAVDDVSEYIFLNLMAFERLHLGAGNEITSYVFFMDSIVGSGKDVSLLRSIGILQNAAGNNDAVAKLFNSLSKDLVLDLKSSLDHVHREVNDYVRNNCQKSWNMWRANLMHTYFRSPWTTISLAAAIFLLGLSAAQTMYTILPYYR